MRYFKLFTHTDLDGVACAVLTTLAADAAGDYLEIEYCAAGTAGRTVGEWVDKTHFVPNMEYVVLVTDISVDEFSAQKLDVLSRKGKNITVAMLDHHELDPRLTGRKWMRVETAETFCGTTLLYDWLIQKKLLKKTGALDRFVNDVCLYDTWRFTREEASTAATEDVEAAEYELVTEDTVKEEPKVAASNAERLNFALYLLGIDSFLNMAVAWFEQERKPLDISKHPMLATIVENEVKRCDTYCRRKSSNLRRTEYKGYKVGYTFAEQYISHLGHYMLTNNPEIDIAAILILPGHVSMRTNREEINLSELAKELGGGGHRKASGHTSGKLPEGITRYLLGFADRIELED